MSSAQQIVPQQRRVDAAELIQELGDATPLRPFDNQVLEFINALSQTLLRSKQAREHAELASLGFFFRPSRTNQLKNEFSALNSRGVLRVPRGLVFHIPPANVDTMFVYSWVISLLLGNTNVVRLPTALSAQQTLLCNQVRALLENPAFASIARRNVMLQYGHDAGVNTILSGGCDLRVIWGGDATIATIRQYPLGPFARDLCFADRTSLCVMKSDAVLDLQPNQLISLAESFYNDSYWFDQLACSSPRMVLWCGGETQSTAAAARFWSSLEQVVDARQYRLDTGNALRKHLALNRLVLDSPAVESVRIAGNGLAVLRLSRPEPLPGEHLGMGIFHELFVEQLVECVALIHRKHQTATAFGFSHEEIADFLVEVNSRGLDRVVPVGKALDFDRFWDGYDLFQEMTRTVRIAVP